MKCACQFVMPWSYEQYYRFNKQLIWQEFQTNVLSQQSFDLIRKVNAYCFKSKPYLSFFENFQLKNQVVYKTEDSVKAVGLTTSRCGAVVAVVWVVERGGGDVTAPLYTKCERRGAPASASQECEPTSRTSLSPHTAYRYAALTDLCDSCCQTYHPIYKQRLITLRLTTKLKQLVENIITLV